jgi:AraC-like DNA-binding protein
VSGSESLFQEYFRLPGIDAGAVWRYSQEHRKPRHFHGHLEFLLVKHGKAIARIGNEVYALYPGHLAWHLPSIPHELVFASHDLDMRVVHIEPDVASAVCGVGGKHADSFSALSAWVHDLGWLATGRPVVELRQADADRLLDDCDAPFDKPPEPAEARVRLVRLLRNALTASRACQATRPSPIVELACCLLLEEPGLDRGGVCRRLDLSAGYLSRCFQKDLGVSFATQRARIRIARFVAHVDCEHQNLLEAALSAGFGSYAQLHRTFCALVGMSPTNYLRRGGRQQRALITR